MVFCIAIGQQTPLVGSTLFVVRAVARRNIFAISRASILIMLIPQITFLLPDLAGMR